MKQKVLHHAPRCCARFMVQGGEGHCLRMATVECDGAFACEVHAPFMTAPADLPYAADVRKTYATTLRGAA